MSLSFTDAAMTYLGQQIGANNKVPAGQSFLIAIAIMEAEGDDSLFLIKGTYSNGAVSNLDKTFAQITAASGNDKVIVMKLTSGSSYYYLPCAKLDSSSAVFADDIESGLKVTLSSADAVTVGTATASVPMTDTTWAALKALRDGGNLTPGMQYRITDYNTIVTGYYDLSAIAEGASGYLHYGTSAGHAFDVIVTADDESTLSENARAALHDGDTYFANSDIGAWELKYCIDNDSTRFAYANSSGKGVIYYMKDEFDNEAGYDFKNWQFVRYALSQAAATQDYTPVDDSLVYDATTQPNRYGSMYQVYMALQAYMQTGSYVNPFIRFDRNNNPLPTDYDLAAGVNILGSIQMASIDATYKATFNADLYYTFDYYDASEGVHVDMSLGGNQRIKCTENKLACEVDMAAAMLMQNTGVIGIGGNVIEYNSVFIDAYIEDYPTSTFYVGGNIFGVYNYCNTFGNYCYSNTFGNYCYSNTFGNSCDSNTFGNSCDSNTFGNYCDSNTFGNSCDSNTFGNYCESTGFMGDFRNCTVGDNVRNNEFYTNGTEHYLVIGDGVEGISDDGTNLGGYSGIREMVSYDAGTGYATIITRTAYGTESAVSTSDGGTTWTAA